MSSKTEELVQEVIKILDGIDCTELEAYERGWWETSLGAKYGAERLSLVIAAIRGLDNNTL